MSSLIVIGNKNKITQTSGKESSSNTFPKCEVKKSFWGGWKWKVTLGGATTKGSINDLSNSFTQQFDGVTVAGSKSNFKDCYYVAISYKEKTKVFIIQDGKVTEG